MLTTGFKDGIVKLSSDNPVMDLVEFSAALKALVDLNHRMRITPGEMDQINMRFTNGPRDFQCDYEVHEGVLYLVGPTQGLICIANRLDFA